MCRFTPVDGANRCSPSSYEGRDSIRDGNGEAGPNPQRPPVHRETAAAQESRQAGRGPICQYSHQLSGHRHRYRHGFWRHQRHEGDLGQNHSFRRAQMGRRQPDRSADGNPVRLEPCRRRTKAAYVANLDRDSQARHREQAAVVKQQGKEARASSRVLQHTLRGPPHESGGIPRA